MIAEKEVDTEDDSSGQAQGGWTAKEPDKRS